MKINKMPEFYTIFARKILFLIFGGVGGVMPSAPSLVSYPMPTLYFQDDLTNSLIKCYVNILWRILEPRLGQARQILVTWRD